MPFVKCSVDGCNTRLQPLLKPDPRDRETWVYRECDLCFRPACAKHSTESDGRIICDRSRDGSRSRVEGSHCGGGVRDLHSNLHRNSAPMLPSFEPGLATNEPIRRNHLSTKGFGDV